MKTFIGFASMSGNTEDIANILQDVLIAKGCGVVMEDLESVDAASLTEYECIFIGAYTWGDGDLPYEAEDFVEALQDVDFTNVKAACFGSGDYAYPQFCAAADILAETLEGRGCSVFNHRLKIELSPESDEQISECRQFAQSVYEWALTSKEIHNV